MRSPGFSESHGAAFDLEELTLVLGEADPRLVVWKGGHDLGSQGDVDAAAPRSSRPALERAFEAWASRTGLAATITCEHAAGISILVGCGGSARERLLQVDVTHEKLVHGAAAWSAEALAEVAVHEGGLRRLTRGAEGVARVLASRADADAAALVRADPAGASALARRLGLRGRLALRSGPAARLALEAALTLHAVASPRSVLRSVATDRARGRCRVIAALQEGRRLRESVERWLERIEHDHEVRRA